MVSLFSGADATSVTQTNAPEWLKKYYENLAKENTNTFNIAKGIYNANTQYQPYTGARVQQFSNDQLAAMQRVRDNLGIGGQNLAAAQQRIGLGSKTMSDAMPLDAGAVQGMYRAFLGRNPSPQEIQHQLNSGVKSVAELQHAIGNSLEAQSRIAAGHTPDMSKLQDGSFRPNAVQTENYNQSYQQGRVNPTTSAAATVHGQAPMMGAPVSADLGNFGLAQAQQYMNPYTQTVIQNTLGEMNRQNAIGQQADNARATAAKAFGGSRHGVMEAERARNFAQEQNNVIGNLNNQNFAQAQAQFNTDTGRRQQNNQSNATLNLQTQMGNQGASMQTLLADQNSLNNINMFNAGVVNNAQLANEQLRQTAFGINRDTFNQNQDRQFATQVQNQNMGLQAYNANRDQFNTDQARVLQGGDMAMQMAPLQQQMAMQDNNNLLNIGGMQQNLGQMGLDTRYQDYLNQKQYPYQQFNFLQGALQGQNFNPYQGLAGSTTTQSGGGPSPISQIAGLGLTALGAYNAFF